MGRPNQPNLRSILLMTADELTTLFQEKLRECSRKKKFQGKFRVEDEARVVQTFRLALENVKLSDSLLLEQLTGEKQT